MTSPTGDEAAGVAAAGPTTDDGPVPPTVGDRAPDVTLTDTHGTPVRLSELRGTPVVLVFFPFAFSGICTAELCELRDNLDVFTAAGVRLVAVSCDPVHALRAWREHEGYTFDLLSDFWPHGAGATAFGVFDDGRGRALRGSFLLDDDGVVRWAVHSPPGQARSLEGYREAIARL